MTASPELRASDADREAVVEELRGHAAEGRIDADELEERVSAAYAARTHGELVPLTADLPKSRQARPRRDVEPRRHRHRPLVPTGLIAADVISVLVWLASGADASFWPKWVLLATAIVFVRRIAWRYERARRR
jgi:hypothetical protein